jgi:hypothetical protein
LDAREKALAEREKALAEREKLVARSRVAPVPRTAPAEPQRTGPPELTGLMADPSQPRTEREQRMQERLTERQRKMEEIQKMRGSRGTTQPGNDSFHRRSCCAESVAYARVILRSR